MSMSVAALSSGFLGPQTHSMNLWLAHAMEFITTRYDVTCKIYDYEFGTGSSSCPSPRQLSDMYGIDFSSPPPLRKVDELSAESMGVIKELASYDVVFVNIFYWGETISRFKKHFPQKRVVYMSHSLLKNESIYNLGRRGEDFERNLADQERVIEDSDMILFPSPWEEICARRLYGLENTGFVYPLPIVPPPERTAAQDDRKKVKFLFIGRYEYRKGLDVVINSFCQYRAKYHSGSLTIVSDVTNPALIFDVLSNKNKEKLRTLLDRQLVEVIRWRNNRRDYLNMLTRLAADNSILIAPSTYEPFNICVMETLMCNMRVIVSRMAGISDLLMKGFEDRVALVDPESPEKILTVMEKFSNAPQPYEPITFPVTPESSYETLAGFLFKI